MKGSKLVVLSASPPTPAHFVFAAYDNRFVFVQLQSVTFLFSQG